MDTRLLYKHSSKSENQKMYINVFQNCMWKCLLSTSDILLYTRYFLLIIWNLSIIYAYTMLNVNIEICLIQYLYTISKYTIK